MAETTNSEHSDRANPARLRPAQRASSLRDLPLDGDGATYGQIYRSLRAAIRSGRLAPGVRLPATRALASDLGVSRTTVLAAFEQLLAEGYAVARTGAGTFVAPQLPDEVGRMRARSAMRETRDARDSRDSRSCEAPAFSRLGSWIERVRPRLAHEAATERSDARFDFTPCVPDVARLPDDAWRRALARTAQATPRASFDYADPSGSRALRRELASYLLRARGVRTSADRIVVVGGVAQALDLCARLFVDPGDRVLVEEPGYVGARRVFGAAGAVLCPAPVDDQGLDLAGVDADATARCKLVYVTPSHQFPRGSVMSLRRRLDLLRFARESNAYVVEDDYDSEFRYSGRAIEALASLDDAGRVLYVGTFSKTLFPSLRTAFIALPEPLVEPFRAAKWLSDWASPTFEQEVLARFLASGDFERHARRARTLYGRARQALFAALESELGARAVVRDSKAGLHVLVRIPGLEAGAWPAIDARLREQGVAAYDARPFYLAPARELELVLGFTRIAEQDVHEGIARLARCL